MDGRERARSGEYRPRASIVNGTGGPPPVDLPLRKRGPRRHGEPARGGPGVGLQVLSEDRDEKHRGGGRSGVGLHVLASVAVLSAAALGYEILLTRLFSIVQWHHFAFLVISVALLGFGASGTFLLVLGERIRTGIEPFLALAALGFGLAAPVCFVIAERVPFNVLDAPWSPGSLGWLLVIELLLAVPFLFAATGIGRALVVFRHGLSRVYAADLAGAGAGAAASVGILYVVPAERALDFVCGLGALAGALAIWGGRSPGRRPLLALCGAVLVLTGFGVTGELRISPFKPLPQALRVTGAELVETRSSPLGMVSAVENRKVPFRQAPGLSLMARAPVPEQVALFVDADGPLAIVRHDASSPPPAYFEDLTSALPYRLVERPRVLVLGAGGGGAVLQALGAGARSVDAVEIQPHVVDMIRGRYRDFSGGVYEHPAVSMHVVDPRAFVEASRDAYDLIQIVALGASTAGLHALKAHRLLTVESVRAVLARLSDDGVAAFTVRARLPPRDGLRLLATVLDALETETFGPPDDHIAWIRSWSTTTLVVSRSALSGAQVEAVRAFAGPRAFDLIHVPGITLGEGNRFNILDRPYFHEAAQRMLGGQREMYVNDYKFDIRPATDDRPYFSSFFKWAHAPEVLALSRKGGIGLLDLGYLALPVALVQAVVASAALILLPLFAIRGGQGCARRWPALAGFFCIGLAFLLIEIAFIGRFTVILSHPLHALAVVLAAFLFFAGVGSYLSGRRGSGASIVVPIIGIAAIATTYALLSPYLTSVLVGAHPAAKIGAAFVLIAPLATLMGMPYPRALARLNAVDPSLLPWAWGINGCASVIGAVLAAFLAIHVGHTVVILVGAVLYAAAAAFVARMAPRQA